MLPSIAERLFAAYGVQPTRLLKPQKGYRNTSYAANTADGLVNVIVYKDEPEIKERIQRTNTVGNYLAAQGLPARRTIDTRLLAMQFARTTRFASLYSYLPGTTIPWESYTKHHIKLLGMCMGLIHQHTVSIDSNDYPHVADEYLEIHERMRHYFAKPGVQLALENKLGLLPLTPTHANLLEACKKLPNQRVLHMDLVRGNVLFGEQQNTALSDGPISLTGILDFEKAAYGHPVFDLARTYAFLLVDCKYKTEDKIEKYFFRSGYAKRGGGAIPTITYKDMDVLVQLTNFFLTYDFYKFLRHNPYESLKDNEHFLRTRDILIARGILEEL